MTNFTTYFLKMLLPNPKISIYMALTTYKLVICLNLQVKNSPI